MFCSFLRFSKDLHVLACVISEGAQRCTVFAHFGNMSSFVASVLSAITKLVLSLLIHACDFRYSKKSCQRANSGTNAPLHIYKKIALCVRAIFVFTRWSGSYVHFCPRHGSSTYRWAKLATHRHRAPHSDGAQRGCRGGAEESAEAGAHGGCIVCVCVFVCVGEGEEGEGEGEGEEELRTSLQVPELSCRILLLHQLW